MYKYGVAVILFNPNKEDISRIKNYDGIFERILLVDNSDNAYLQHVDKILEIPDLDYHSMGGNEGMSEALNYSYIWAKNNNIDFLLTMDQDTDFWPRDIKKIIQVIENENSKDIALYAPNYRKVYLGKQGETYGPWKINTHKIVKVKKAMTSGCFSNVNIINQYLPLDNLFIGMVDDDLSYTLRINGYIIKMIGNAGLSQRVGEITKDTLYNKLIHKNVLSPVRYYYMGRNSRYLIKKYREHKNICKEIVITRIRILTGIILGESKKISKLREWFYGTFLDSDELGDK